MAVEEATRLLTAWPRWRARPRTPQAAQSTAKNNKICWISGKKMPRLSAKEAERIDRKTREHLEQQHAEVIRKRRQKERQWAKARKASAKPPTQHDAQREKFCAA